MTDLNTLITEAEKYGEVGKVREFVGRTYMGYSEDAPYRWADTALTDALTLVVQQGQMLEVACGWIRDAYGGEWRNMNDADIRANLLARRATEDSREEHADNCSCDECREAAIQTYPEG